MSDTIYALSSGAPPAGVGVIRISGPQASAVLARLGRVPAARRATLMTLRDGGEVLDSALVLWLPGPGTATGEDCAELHCHGGRAVIAAVLRALSAVPGLRAAEAGEFTRRAFANGRIDLAEAEGLADLLSAETELQRRAAQAMLGGAFSRVVAGWRDDLLTISASIEAAIDFADEDDVGGLPADLARRLAALADALAQWLSRPRAEALREGVRVVIAGPPNAGKSTLFNALVGSEAAITADIPGTTRDVLSRPVAIGGVPFTLIDTAGLRGETDDTIEAIGIARAQAAMAEADIVLWLGPEGEGPIGAWEISARADVASAKASARHVLSAMTGMGVLALCHDLVQTARDLLPAPGEAALNRRQRDLIAEALHAIEEAQVREDLLLMAEALRMARVAFDRIIGRAGTEDMLDALFGQFCIGK